MTGTPPWGTPTAPEPEPAPRRTGPTAAGVGRAAEAHGFVLLVEQLAGGGDSTTWRLDPPPLPAGPTRQEARAAALHCARTHRPHHPFKPQQREVYRLDEDTYVVVVTGMTRTFHFRVSVAERLGPA